MTVSVERRGRVHHREWVHPNLILVVLNLSFSGLEVLRLPVRHDRVQRRVLFDAERAEVEPVRPAIEWV